MKAKQRLNLAVCYLLVIILAILSLFPILWMISTAFKLRTQTYILPPLWIPRPPTIDNFKTILTALPFMNYFVNSLYITIVVVAAQLLLGVFSAYGFSRLRFKGRDTLFFVLLSSLMVPQIVAMIPQYMMIQKLRLIDTFSAVIIPQIFMNVLGIFLMRQYFQGIPKDFEEAAKIDGAGILKTFLFIMVPQIKPIIATVGVMSFLKSWNNFLWPLVVLNSPQKQVLTVGLNLLQGEFVSDWSSIMAGATMTLMPILLVYLFAQKYFVQSIYMSGIK